MKKSIKTCLLLFIAVGMLLLSACPSPYSENEMGTFTINLGAYNRSALDYPPQDVPGGSAGGPFLSDLKFEVIFTNVVSSTEKTFTFMNGKAASGKIAVGTYTVTMKILKITDNSLYTHGVAENNPIEITSGTNSNIQIKVYDPDAALPPVISAHPASANFVFGETPSALTVTAASIDDGVLSYQWYSHPSDDISVGSSTLLGSEVSQSFTPSIATVGTFYYYVVVTNTSTATPPTATVTSNIATVSVHKNLSINVINPTTALTPMEDSPYDERVVTFNITIPELTGAETVTVGLASNTYGLSITPTSVGTLGATLTLTYNGTTAVTATNPVSVGLTVSTAGYGLPGTTEVSVNIIDGQAAGARAIPVKQSNIDHFNVYANTTAGLTRHYVLSENVILTSPPPGGSNWTPIGPSSSITFTGTFDGNDKTISNLIINDPSSDLQGLFGRINGDGATTGIVKNLGLLAISVTGNNSIGGVAGSNGGTIENCYSTGSVTGNAGRVGGVVGAGGGTIRNCYSTGSVAGSDYYVGGVAGSSGGTMENCYSTASVTSTTHYVGGVVGLNSFGSTMENCYFTGSVTGGQNIGGVAGNSHAIMENCYSTGSVTGSHAVGGIVGQLMNGTVKNCYSTGSVIGTGTMYAGGVVGQMNGGTVENCYSSGSVTGNDDVGGVAGSNTTNVKNCVSLNPSLTRSSGTNNAFGRVMGSNAGGTQTGNYAWDGMLFINVTPPGSSTTFPNAAPASDPDDLNGANLTGAAVKTQAAWETAGFVFNGNPWVWNGNSGMPSLNSDGTVQPWPGHL